MFKSIGFIGAGRVAHIMLGGWKKKGAALPPVVVCDSSPEALAALTAAFPQVRVGTLEEVAGQALVFAAVHPPAMGETLARIAPHLKADAVLVSLARLGWERSSTSHQSLVPNVDLAIRTQALSATVAALRPFDLGPITLGVGVEAGAWRLSQKVTNSWDGNPAVMNPPPALAIPGQLPSGTSWGPLAGPVLQMDVRLGQRWYGRLDAGVPLCWMQVKDNRGETHGDFGWRARLMAGVGRYF